MKRDIVIALIISIVVVMLASAFASTFPDGLERVADALGFGKFAVASHVPSPFPNYAFESLGSGFLSTFLAGSIGSIVAFLAVFLIAKIVRGKFSKNA